MIMPSKNTHKINKIAHSISVALIATSALSLANAQETEDNIEVIAVKGLRGSAMKSMDIKRDSSGVVDAISAEDIGKFPDTNLAESLQRISGVSIDRKNGEGSQVTVRGFGPKYNLITLNGRTMPSSQISADGGLINDRSFDMSNIASEGISGVEVYKTGKANINSGGIGATINLKTRRPFDNPGLNFSVGAKALHDTTNRIGDDVTPEASGFFSWTDEDEVWGLSMSASHQLRDSAQTGMYTGGWSDYSGPWAGPSFFNGIDQNSQDAVYVENAPGLGQQTNMTTSATYFHADHERERTNGQIVLQFRPSDSVTTTIDYLFAEQKSFMNRAQQSFWFGGGQRPVTDVRFDDNSLIRTPTDFYIVDPTGFPSTAGLDMALQQGNVQNRLESLGFNAEWDVNDDLSLSLDFHDSSSESLPAPGAVTNWLETAVGARGMSELGYANSDGLLLLVGQFDDDFDPTGELTGVVRDGGLVPNELDKGDINSNVRNMDYDRVWSDIKQIKLDGRYIFENGSLFNFGIQATSMENIAKSSQDFQLFEGGWGQVKPGDVPDEMLSELDYSRLFDGYSFSLSPEQSAFFESASSGTPQVLSRGFIGDAAEIGKILSDQAGLSWAPNMNDSVNRLIKEDIFAAYGQLDMETELGNMPVDILVGIRYEKTDVKSVTQVAETTLVWLGDNDYQSLTGDLASAPLVEGTGSYSHILPSLDISLHITENLISRFSIGKSISRADYNQLSEGVSGIGGPNGGPLSLGGTPGFATSGSPSLRPVESNNLDLSLEWYYDDTSYVSIGYFDKRVPNFIGQGEDLTSVDGVRDPSNGPRVEAAIAELESRGIAVNQQSVFQMVASMNDTNNGCVNVNAELCGMPFDSVPYSDWENGVDIVATSDDPDLMSRVIIPVNSQDAKLSGWELALQHFFGESGYGVQANYTIVNGSVGFDVAADPSTNQFALTGLSDSANFTILYEKFGIQARLAYNWRDKFLSGISSNEPIFVEAYDQLDFSIGYEVMENMIVSLEGINVLEENQRIHGRTESQLNELSILGARYALTARYTF